MLDKLRAMYPWPEQCPDVPEDLQGWLCPASAGALAKWLTPTAKLVVECGTWLGKSAVHILKTAPQAQLICVDTWMGSPEHFRLPVAIPRLKTLRETCQRNLWEHRDRVTLLRGDSLYGLALVYDLGLTPDLIYIDSKHTTGRVTAELSVCLELFPDTPVVGDDFNKRPVKRAVESHVALTNRPLHDYHNAFALAPWMQI